VVIVYGMGMGTNLEYSSIQMKVADEIPANVDSIKRRYGEQYVSPELYLGTQIGVRQDEEPSLGLVRGVTPSSLLVRSQIEIVAGHWPEIGEVMVGRLAATKLGVSAEELAIGKNIFMEGQSWRISAVFTACGSVFESEVWCRLDDLQQSMKRQDLSLVAMTLDSSGDFAEVQMVCMENRHLEVIAIREPDYYAALQKDYRPVRMLAWLVVLLVSGAGIFAGLNTMHGAVLGRVRELSTLQTIGFLRRAIVVSLIQEGVLLAAAGCLIASALVFTFVSGAAIRFTMGAFALEIDGVAVLIACGTGLLLGVLGSIPPAIRALRMPVVDGLKSI
jgi:putative ABC transport system permease protein